MPTCYLLRHGAICLVLRVELHPCVSNAFVPGHAFLGGRPLELVPIFHLTILPHSLAACITQDKIIVSA